MRILLSRTDSIGDVVLTLPMAGVIKKHYPDAHIIFLGKEYTRAIVALSRHVDEFLDWGTMSRMTQAQRVDAFRALSADVVIHVFPVREIAEVARKAGIAKRIGATGRLYHWLYCNERVAMSRRRSDLHEAQLNMQLLRPLGITEILSQAEIPQYYGFAADRLAELPDFADIPRDEGRKTVILHPRSKGSAREWGLENFKQLISLLRKENMRIYITGTREEAETMYASGILSMDGVEDMTGLLTLPQLVAFIARADVLVAASTGPLHIAAALGIKAIGLFPPIRPMHPGRWAPLGQNAHYLVKPGPCSDCRHIEKTLNCACMAGISPEDVFLKIMN